MSGSDDPFRNGPLSLEQALLACGDPVAVAEMSDLYVRGYGGPWLFCLGRETEGERNVFRYRKLRDQLEGQVLQSLQAGSLIATGYENRSVTDPPVTIPPDRWRTLQPDFINSTATGEGIKLVGLQVRCAKAAEACVPSAVEPRLVLDCATRLVRFDRRDAILPPRPFQLLRLLAVRTLEGHALVANDDIYAEIFSKQTDAGHVRKLVDELRKLLREKFPEAEGVSQLIQNRSRLGYGLALTAGAVRIVP